MTDQHQNFLVVDLTWNATLASGVLDSSVEGGSFRVLSWGRCPSLATWTWLLGFTARGA